MARGRRRPHRPEQAGTDRHVPKIGLDPLIQPHRVQVNCARGPTKRLTPPASMIGQAAPHSPLASISARHRRHPRRAVRLVRLASNEIRPRNRHVELLLGSTCPAARAPSTSPPGELITTGSRRSPIVSSSWRSVPAFEALICLPPRSIRGSRDRRENCCREPGQSAYRPHRPDARVPVRPAAAGAGLA